MLRGIIEIYVINRIIPSTNLAPYLVHPNPPGFRALQKVSNETDWDARIQVRPWADAKYGVAANFLTTMLDRNRLRDSYSNE